MARIAPYAEQHKWENLVGPDKDDRPSALQIIKDQGLEGQWAGRVAIVTGCSPGGIGPDTARAIHATGADVYITARDLTKGRKVASDILSDGKPGKVEVLEMDLSSLESVRAAAKTFLETNDKLHLLINNAGVMACPYELTKDGFELQFGTNHLGHFLFFKLLEPALIAASTPSLNSRVINVSSAGHYNGTIDLQDPNFTNRPYEPWAGYGQAKLANIHMANEIERRYGSKGLHAFSLMPGGIHTELQKHSPAIQEMMTDPNVIRFMKSTSQGAATSVWAAVAKELEGRGGVYLEDCAEAVHNTSEKPSLSETGVRAHLAYDPPTEKALWTASLKWVGLNDE